MSEIIDKALLAKRESKNIEFKESFNPDNPGHWCELVKDLVALTNTGGGVIIIGLNNNGAPSGVNIDQVMEIDPAVITDKVHKYTGYHFNDFNLHQCIKDDKSIFIIEISASRLPLVFEKVGNYEESPGKQKNAFSMGTVYFRHGAKSEPGNNDDIRRSLERQLESIRKEWLDGVRKVVRAPEGSLVSILNGEVRQSSSPNATPIRIVNDPNAPAFRAVNPDDTHPYRQKELLNIINTKLSGMAKVNSYDVLAVRKTYDSDKDKQYVYLSKFAAPQYSDEFVNWLLKNYFSNEQFFIEARAKVKIQQATV